jgi:hypothetical protein
MPIFPGRLILWLRINTDEQSEGKEVLAAEGEIEITDDLSTRSCLGERSSPGSRPVLRAVPNDSFGGVLNFKKQQQKERWTLGEEKAGQFIREHRALLEPIIAAVHPDPGVVA